MVYIAVVNPAILSETGMDFGAVFVATVLAASLSTLIMGVFANYPIAIAPGMGLNAYFAYSVVGQNGVGWETAMGAVLVAGLLFLLLTLTTLRESLIKAIPTSLKNGITAGIGLFIAFIGLKSAGIIVDDEVNLVGLGDLHAPVTVLSLAAHHACTHDVARTGSALFRHGVHWGRRLAIGNAPHRGTVGGSTSEPRPNVR